VLVSLIATVGAVGLFLASAGSSACSGQGCPAPPHALAAPDPEPTISPPRLVLTASAASVVCGSTVTVSLRVEGDDDGEGASGAVVTFTTNTGDPPLSTTTPGGAPGAVFVAPIGLNGPLIITATIGDLVAQVAISVTCDTPAPPAKVTLRVTPASVTCGSAASVFATVTDRFGSPVADGTRVDLRSDLGSVAGTPAIAGRVTAVFTSFPGSPGLAQIVAVAGAVTASTTVEVVCAAPAPPPTAASPGALQPEPARAGVTPPSTGDGGVLHQGTGGQ